MTRAVTLAQQASSTTFNVPYRNRVINGAMAIDQRSVGGLNTNVSPSSGIQWAVDRFRIGGNGGAVYRFSVQQVQDAPTGFQYSVKYTTTTASAAAANDLAVLSHIIEGYNIADFAWGTVNAQTVTLSFWLKASVAGTYNLRIQSGSGSYVTSYTVSATGTWEYKTITVPGSSFAPTSVTNSEGIRIDWNLNCGSSSQTATTNSWVAGNYFSTSSSVQLGANSGATWQITGVQFELGGSATTFEVRPYGLELFLCQRYYEKSFAPTVVPNNANATLLIAPLSGWAGSGGHPIPYKATKRSNPSVSTYGSGGVLGFVTNGGLPTTQNGVQVWANNLAMSGLNENFASVGNNYSQSTLFLIYGGWASESEM